jgi:hypothetical protein
MDGQRTHRSSFEHSRNHPNSTLIARPTSDSATVLHSLLHSILLLANSRILLLYTQPQCPLHPPIHIRRHSVRIQQFTRLQVLGAGAILSATGSTWYLVYSISTVVFKPHRGPTSTTHIQKRRLGIQWCIGGHLSFVGSRVRDGCLWTRDGCLWARDGCIRARDGRLGARDGRLWAQDGCL